MAEVALVQDGQDGEVIIDCVAIFYEEGKGGENYRKKNKFRCRVSSTEKRLVKLKERICELAGIKETAKLLGLGENLRVELNRSAKYNSTVNMPLLLWIYSVCMVLLSASDIAKGNCKDFDFENGAATLSEWTKTGHAFDGQPTYGDNARIRDPRINTNVQGDWWIGTFENRSNPEEDGGYMAGDYPVGTLTSPKFRIIGPKISFLLGGGCDVGQIRVELLVNGQVVREAFADECREHMRRREWYVRQFKNQFGQIRLVDASRKGHINFDDLWGDFTCTGNETVSMNLQDSSFSGKNNTENEGDKDDFVVVDEPLVAVNPNDTKSNESLLTGTDDEYGALQKAARPQAPMQQNPTQAGSDLSPHFLKGTKISNSNMYTAPKRLSSNAASVSNVANASLDTLGDESANNMSDLTDGQSRNPTGNCKYFNFNNVSATLSKWNETGPAFDNEGGFREDYPEGTLTSPKFRIMGPKLSFLLGGGCDLGKIRVELLVNGQVVRKALADKCRENMRRREWDVRQFKNQFGRIRLVDASGNRHINFDDLWADFACRGNCKYFNFKNGSATLSKWNKTGPALDNEGRFREDYPEETLTSPKFRIIGPKMSFLLGGGCDMGKIRVELLVNGQVVRKALADECRDNMRRREWDVRQFKNQFGRLRFVTASGKGLINFDDLWADFSCTGDESDAVQTDSKLEGTLQNTLEQKGNCKYFNFKNGSATLSEWNKTGPAFINEGGFREDYPEGTLTSPKFRIIGPKMSFLLGGGCDMGKIRVELLVNGQVVRKALADECRENMRRREWDVRQFKNQFGRLRFVDASGNGHINFDDLSAAFTCSGDETETTLQHTLAQKGNCKDLDFSNGSAALSNWNRTGRAFDRGVGFKTEDYPMGTLTSPKFRIMGPKLSFLLGGGCDLGKIRVELLVNDQVVRKAFANECRENMRRREWDVRQFKNQVGQIRLVDASRKGHINFDDLWGDFTCNGDESDAIQFDSKPQETVQQTQKGNCKDLDFSNGSAALSNWSRTGRAFDRGVGFKTEDYPMGTLTSPKFRIMGPKLSFLLGGGCDLGKIRVELLVNDQVVRKAFADECRENMRRREWDVRQFKNQVGQIRLVDASRKGHIKFDDLWGDFTCNGDESDATQFDSKPQETVQQTQKGNCKDFGFENGFASLSKWSKTGRAFDQNERFITEDYPVGTLTSPKFRIIGHKLSFLLGGGCDVGKIRVELLVNGHVVRKAFADECREKMRRREWDVRQFKNRIAQIRLVDASRQGHMNFDDLWGDFTCIGDETDAAQITSNPLETVQQTLGQLPKGQSSLLGGTKISDSNFYTRPIRRPHFPKATFIWKLAKASPDRLGDNSSNLYLPKDDELRNLSCKSFLVKIKTGKPWDNDFLFTSNGNYQSTRREIEVKVLDAYEDDKDFRGAFFTKFSSYDEPGEVKAFFVLRFRAVGKFLGQLIDKLGAGNVSAAGCFDTSNQCPNPCPLTCAPLCQSSCCQQYIPAPAAPVAQCPSPCPQTCAPACQSSCCQQQVAAPVVPLVTPVSQCPSPCPQTCAPSCQPSCCQRPVSASVAPLATPAVPVTQCSSGCPQKCAPSCHPSCCQQPASSPVVPLAAPLRQCPGPCPQKCAPSCQPSCCQQHNPAPIPPPVPVAQCPQPCPLACAPSCQPSCCQRSGSSPMIPVAPVSSFTPVTPFPQCPSPCSQSCAPSCESSCCQQYAPAPAMPQPVFPPVQPLRITVSNPQISFEQPSQQWNPHLPVYPTRPSGTQGLSGSQCSAGCSPNCAPICSPACCQFYDVGRRKGNVKKWLRRESLQEEKH